ncbi:MAG: hypothetical protein DWQ47_00650 [Acidobacteria bacterium]|nr:MAG: hypothetical protein DWQ32_11110 [Acidobacteriota bacterium]REK04019.1 MAG: hypothetical protein DWQ38_00635 [Acidobacteriota bacterium]REK15181.1 MAG: hypothetical protein DWQ43_16800 [Acidobacteriota bacterium]REK46271.1 MAG: hypothetical protein DWQ47_00650 [Acidobacteriota bacterium]
MKQERSDIRSEDPAFLRSKLLIFWALLSFVGLLLTVSYIVPRAASGEPFTILGALNEQMIRFQIWTAMAILIIWNHKFFSRISRSWYFLFPAHVLSGIVWSIIATAAMVVVVWFFDGLINAEYRTLAERALLAGAGSVVMGVVGYKIILTTNLALDFSKKFNDEKNRAAELESQLAQAQLQALKMQLQPHFLFNTLNSLSSLALEDPRQTVHMISRLGDFLRMTVDSNGTQTVSLEKELDFLKNYLEIEKVRFRDRLEPEFDIDPHTLDLEVPNLLLQPGVENAIKHGVSKSMSAGRIRVSSSRREDRLVLEIFNDGPPSNGRQEGKLKEGVGIANTRERLRQIYGEDFELDFELIPAGGAKLTISLPLRGPSHR